MKNVFQQNDQLADVLGSTQSRSTLIRRLNIETQGSKRVDKCNPGTIVCTLVLVHVPIAH